jgi:hypothetical protein
MCLNILGIAWILAGIGVTILGAKGKSVNIGWKRANYVQGSSAVAYGIFAIIVGIAFLYFGNR